MYLWKLLSCFEILALCVQYYYDLFKVLRTIMSCKTIMKADDYIYITQVKLIEPNQIFYFKDERIWIIFNIWSKKLNFYFIFI